MSMVPDKGDGFADVVMQEEEIAPWPICMEPDLFSTASA